MRLRCRPLQFEPVRAVVESRRWLLIAVSARSESVQIRGRAQAIVSVGIWPWLIADAIRTRWLARLA